MERGQGRIHRYQESGHSKEYVISADSSDAGLTIEKLGHVRCSGGGVFGSLNHSSASIKNMFRNWVSQFN